MSQIRVLIVDDHEVVRLGITSLLKQHPGLWVVGEAADGEEAIRQALALQPDIVLLDIQMPGMLGVEACRRIVEQLPETRVIMLTSYADDNMLFSAIQSGAAGYILKRIDSDELVRKIEAVHRGESVLDSAMTESLFEEVRQARRQKESATFADLSDQELRILALIADGLTNRQIAKALFLGEGTVRNYISNLLNKLKLSNRAAAAAFAVKHNIKEYLRPE